MLLILLIVGSYNIRMLQLGKILAQLPFQRNLLSRPSTPFIFFDIQLNIEGDPSQEIIMLHDCMMATKIYDQY